MTTLKTIPVDKIDIKNAPARRAELIAEAQKTEALTKIDNPRSMLNHRIRQLKKKGMSNVAIGNLLNISDSTVRRRLKMPLDTIDILLDKILEDLEHSREDLIAMMIHYPEFKMLFGDDAQTVIRVHTNSRKASIDPKNRRVKFSLEFIATIKESD